MATTIISAAPRDLIALAWYRMGYRPRESLIAVGLHGPRRRAGVVARLDLPAARTRRVALQGLARMLRRAGEEQAVVLVVSDVGGDPRPGPDGRPVPVHRVLVHQVRRELPRHGIGVVDVLAVGPTAFRSCLCEDLRCCPVTGTSLAEVAASEVSASMVLAGIPLGASAEATTADVEPVPPPTAEPGRGTAGWGAPGNRAPALARWRQLLDEEATDPGPLPGLLEALADTTLRDALLVSLVPGAGRSPERLLAAPDGRDLPELFGRRPDPELAERGRRVLAAAARYAPAGRRAEPLSMLAWLAWWCGDGARARHLTQRALADAPGQRLATLVGELLARGAPPPWAAAEAGTRPTGGRHGQRGG